MSHPSSRAAYCGQLINNFGLSPQERFGLGVSLIYQCAEQAQNECPPEMDHPFVGVELDPEQPFQSTIRALEALEKWEAKQKAEQAAAEPAPELADEGRAEAVDAGPIPPVEQVQVEP